MSASRDRLLSLLRERSFAKRRVVLASGKESDFFIDCKQTVLTAEGHALVAEVMADAAQKFVNFVLSEKESANLTNDTSYPSAVPSSKRLVRAEVTSDPSVFPPADVIRKLSLSKPVPPELMRLQNRLWTKLKTE